MLASGKVNEMIHLALWIASALFLIWFACLAYSVVSRNSLEV